VPADDVTPAEFDLAETMINGKSHILMGKSPILMGKSQF
jgi:hypothetical protein